MGERKHISKIGRQPRHKSQMIYYSFQQKYLWRSAGSQVRFWQSTEEDKRVSAERCTAMRSHGVFGRIGRQRRCWNLSSQVGVSGIPGGKGAQMTEMYVESNFAKGISVVFLNIANL